MTEDTVYALSQTSNTQKWRHSNLGPAVLEVDSPYCDLQLASTMTQSLRSESIKQDSVSATAV